ncbi:Uncharacterized protein SCG7109_AK_00140 [Chlamydiales bacterium SCGC AG-110-M15]|nr:Uncharacterized protein SCG7109_AK_00140 [Chlamydiales bacterium SCGC AG-110-M15]
MLFCRINLLCLLLACGICASTFADTGAGDDLSLEDFLERQQDHLILNDSRTALSEALRGVEEFPDSIEMRKALLRAYAKSGNERRTLLIWDQYKELNGDNGLDEELLETVAWTIIKKGAQSSSVVPQYFSLIGSALTQDAYAVEIVEAGMANSSIVLRLAAVKMVTLLRDRRLINRVMEQAIEDQSWQVRYEAIKVLGGLEVEQARGLLESIIASEAVEAQERSAAIQALVKIRRGVTKEEIEGLAVRNRFGLRVLAADLAGHFGKADAQHVLGRLTTDSHPHVRASALRALGLLEHRDVEKCVDWAGRALEDADKSVKVTAAFLMILVDHERGVEAFRELFDESVQKRWEHYAAAALAAAGEAGIALAKEVHSGSQDLFVRANLALGLISHRVNVDVAAESLRELFIEHHGKIAFDEDSAGGFRVLSSSRVRNMSGMKNYPGLVDQMARLELLDVLSMVEHPKAQETIREYLLETDWRLMGEAAALILREGDEGMHDLLRALLEDENHRVRVAAALVLAVMGRDLEVLSVLREAYDEVDREHKIQILDALGHLKSRDSIDFLERGLGESSQTLRIVAASSLLRCLRG